VRIGIGYDIHPLAPGCKLVLGGVQIPCDEGLEGWSDADALTHAVIDALLGAAALGDIGSHFPADDLQYKDISSLVLLEKVKNMLAENGYRLVNIDATIIAEQPRLHEYIDGMRQKLGETLGIEKSQVSVKASTANTLGSIGRGEGIAALAVVLIDENTE